MYPYRDLPPPPGSVGLGGRWRVGTLTPQLSRNSRIECIDNLGLGSTSDLGRSVKSCFEWNSFQKLLLWVSAILAQGRLLGRSGGFLVEASRCMLKELTAGYQVLSRFSHFGAVIAILVTLIIACSFASIITGLFIEPGTVSPTGSRRAAKPGSSPVRKRQRIQTPAQIRWNRLCLVVRIVIRWRLRSRYHLRYRTIQRLIRQHGSQYR